MKYFLQSTETRKDLRIRKIIRELGMPGLGAYMMLLEELCKVSSLSIDADILWLEMMAEESRTEVELWNSLLDLCADIKLINQDAWSQKIVSIENLDLGFIKLPKPTNSKYRKHQEFVFKRDAWQCVYCGSTEDLTLDHVIPQSRGGSDKAENLVTCCFSCNSSKGARTPEEWKGA